MSESDKIGLSKSVENKTCYIFSSVAQNELIFGQSQYSNLFHVSWSFNGDSIYFLDASGWDNQLVAESNQHIYSTLATFWHQREWTAPRASTQFPLPNFPHMALVNPG